MTRNPERAHLVGVYGLGKCQRLIKLCREAGYDAPIYLHGALFELTRLYQRLGIDLGDVRHVGEDDPPSFAGALVLCPPSAVDDRWSRRFPDPVTAFASGWMRIKGRVRQAGVELPLVISDHADWDELTLTAREVAPNELWITHGEEAALVHWAATNGITARPLSIKDYGDEEGSEA